MSALLFARGGVQVSWKHIFASIAGVSTTAAVSALSLRQYHFRSSDVFKAAREQVMDADAVRKFLGGNVVSTKGILGGYILPLMGTAVITFPVHTDNGVMGVVRVEAEAEWLGTPEAERSEEQVKSANPRWLLRHLEVELPSASKISGSINLYTLPPRTKLSHWAPLHENDGSLLPRWLRDFLPVHGLREDSELQKLCSVFVLVLLLHTATFALVRGPVSKRRAVQV